MPWRNVGEWRHSSTILDLSTWWRWIVRFTPRPLYPGEIPPSSQWIGGWVGPRAGLNAVEKRKILPLPEIETQPSSLARRYADWAIQTSTIFRRGKSARTRSRSPFSFKRRSLRVECLELYLHSPIRLHRPSVLRHWNSFMLYEVRKVPRAELCSDHES
jgi:hypothetical protein